jgi:hypothetical protein
MAYRILACFALFAAALHAERGWHFYPVNSEEAGVTRSGLVLYFGSAPAVTATVTVLAQDCGTQRTATVTLETDGRRGGLVQFPVASLDTLVVQRITVTLGGRTVTVAYPKAGKLYGYQQQHPQQAAR